MVSPKRQPLVFTSCFVRQRVEVSGNPNRDLLHVVVPSTKKVAVEAESAKLFSPPLLLADLDKI